MRQQRVALVSSSYHPRIGGVEQHVRRTAEALVAGGHHVEVWTVARDGDPDRAEVDGIRVRRLPCPLPRQSVDGVVEFASALPTALRAWFVAWRALRPTIVHVHCFGPNGPWALAAAALSRRPLVLTSHGETFADQAVFDDSVLLRVGLRAAVRRARAVTGASATVLADLRERFGLAGGSVVHGGVAPTAESAPGAVPGLPAGGRYVLGAGRLMWVKGFDLLVAAGDLLPDDCRVVLVGDGPERPELAASDDRTILLGAVEPDQVGPLMQGAAAVAVPSRREAFGLVVLEAWAAGVPVVAAQVDGPAELLRHGVDGLLVAPDDAQALGDALREVLDDRALALRLAEAGRARARELTWAATADAYASIYDRVTGVRSHRAGPRIRRGSTSST